MIIWITYWTIENLLEYFFISRKRYLIVMNAGLVLGNVSLKLLYDTSRNPKYHGRTNHGFGVIIFLVSFAVNRRQYLVNHGSTMVCGDMFSLLFVSNNGLTVNYHRRYENVDDVVVCTVQRVQPWFDHSTMEDVPWSKYDKETVIQPRFLYHVWTMVQSWYFGFPEVAQ